MQCQHIDCIEIATHRVGWQPAAARQPDHAVTVDRSWFYGCADHARWVWKTQAANGASPVWNERRVEKKLDAAT